MKNIYTKILYFLYKEQILFYFRRYKEQNWKEKNQTKYPYFLSLYI